MSKHRLRNNSTLDLLTGRFKHSLSNGVLERLWFKRCLRVFSWSSVLKWPEIDGLLRNRQLLERKRDYANRRYIHVRKIRLLRDRFSYPLKEYDDEDFRQLLFRLSGKDTVTDLLKLFDEELSTSYRGRSTAAFKYAASSNCFEILYNRNLRAGYWWRFIWSFCFCCMHSHSQSFKGYHETKRTFSTYFLSFPENLANTKRKFYTKV